VQIAERATPTKSRRARTLALLGAATMVATAITVGGVASAGVLSGNAPDAAATTAVTDPEPPRREFDMSLLPNEATVSRGNSVETIVIPYFVSTPEPDVTVNLSVTGVPDGVTTSFSPPQVTIGLSTLTLNVSKTTRTGRYLLTVTGTTKNTVEQATFVLRVNR
jgi:hypothetical protein